MNPSQGIWRIIPSATLTEIIAQSGFDFQILDCEHGGYDFITLKEDIRICDLNKCKAYVRVSGIDKVQVQRCLDLGAKGIVFPQLSDYEDFVTATKLMNYAPKGVRGYNPFVRANAYGTGPALHDKTECITILETLQAVDDIDRILGIKAIDMIYIGSYDLSAQLGCIGEMTNPKLTAIVNLIIEKCLASKKSVGVMVGSVEQYAAYKQKGINVFVHTVDSFRIKKAFSDVIAQYK